MPSKDYMRGLHDMYDAFYTVYDNEIFECEHYSLEYILSNAHKIKVDKLTKKKESLEKELSAVAEELKALNESRGEVDN